MDRAIAYSINRPVTPLAAYLLSTSAVVTTALLRMVLVTSLLPWLLFVPVVLICALAFGSRPAVWSLTLSAIFAGATIALPGEPYLLTGSQWAATLVYFLVGAVLITVGQQLRDAFGRADALVIEREAALELAEARRDQLAESEGFLRSILSSSSDCIKVLDLEGKLRFMNDGGKQVMEVEDFGAIEGCVWNEFWQGDGNAAAQKAVAAAQRGESASFMGEAATMAGNAKWWDVAVTPILDSAGKPERILSVSRDVSKSRAADAQVRLLNAELGHRLKNTLALVQAIAAQTLKPENDFETARDALIDRLVALGRGADILTASSWEAAELGHIARTATLPHVQEQNRITITGPRVTLSSRLALSLSLALHELATNAIKYGALSNDDGQVALSWEIDNESGPNLGRLRLIWEETGGPPVTEPKRKGFGSLLIGRALSANFKGASTVEYRPEGVVFKLDAPVSTLNEVEHG